MPTVYLPAPLRRLTGGASRVEVPPGTIEDVLRALDERYPGIRAQLCEPDGSVRAFINVFVNGAEIRTLQGQKTPVGESDEVSIIPAMAGGAARGCLCR